jgi:hypothetical protein
VARFRFRADFSPWYFLGGLGIAAIGGSALRAFSDLPFWACFAITLFAVLVNGWLATWEDEQPGGFDNPKDDQARNRPSTPKVRPPSYQSETPTARKAVAAVRETPAGTPAPNGREVP